MKLLNKLRDKRIELATKHLTDKVESDSVLTKEQDEHETMFNQDVPQETFNDVAVLN